MDLVVHKLNVKLLDDKSASASYTTEPFSIQSFSLFCVHHYWSGVAFSGSAPTIDVYGSNNLDAPFVSLGVGIALSVGANGYLTNFEKAGFAYIKIVYNANTATAGLVSTYINAKVL